MAYSNNVWPTGHVAQTRDVETQQPRSFTTIGANITSEQKSSGVALNPSFGNANKTWGTNNIWGNGSLSNGFSSRATTRDNSTSRDAAFQSAHCAVDPVEAKSGSGSLVDSSVSDEWSYRTSWGAKRSLPSARSISQVKHSEGPTSQQRSISNVGLTQPFTASSRPPTINLSTAPSTQSRSSYGFTFSGSPSGRVGEQPPNVYTKFDRPIDPNSRKLSDSAKGGLWFDSSPVEERSGLFSAHPSSRGSLPGSRNGSQPPSRHGDDRPFFSKPDYSRPAQRPFQSNSRTPSLSSQGNGSFGGSYKSSNTDQLTHQFGQLGMNGSSRPTSSYKSSIASGMGFGDALSLNGVSPSLRTSFAGSASGMPLADDQDDSYGFEGYASPSQPHGFPDYPDSAVGDRFLQANVLGDSRQSSSLANSNGAFVGYEGSSGSRSSLSWQASSNSGMALTRMSPISPEEAAFHDPRMQQLIGAQLRNPYNSLYSPYTLAAPLQLNTATPFGTFMPINMAEMGAATASLDALNGDNTQSSIMYEFKSNTKSKRYELKDIYNHIAEFSGDQHGSRFIQTKLETANSDEKERVFQEIKPNALPLMTDVFGNYVIQKFFEHGDQNHKKTLANIMKGQVLHLSLQMYGCRVVQKALDHVLVDQQAQLISELEGNVLKCVKDQNGNHVIQKAIERCGPNNIGFIINAFRGQVQHLSIHPYGCRVIQRCLERCEPHSKALIMRELMEGVQSMISDQYGNYVVQHVVEHDAGDARRLVLDIVGSGLEAYSKHKFASNVVEKCLEKADDGWRRDVLATLANGEQRRCEGESVLVSLIKDNFGNYVIRK